MTKQDWFVAVDAALAAAGQPPMIYGYELTFLRHTGGTGQIHVAGSLSAAKSKVKYQMHFRAVTRIEAYTYAQYVQVFGIPGSKM